jgi:type III restriction enzyme
MTAEDVLEKAKAAVQYCKHATDHNMQNGGKEWKYLLIPHSDVLPNMSLGYLAGKRIFMGETN